MIKFVADKDGRPMIGLGLSRGNCEKLVAGKPIFIDLKVMLCQCEPPPDLNDATILIFGGESEEVMMNEFHRHGIRTPKPRTHQEEN